MIILPLIFTLVVAQQTPQPSPEARALMLLGMRSAQLQRVLPTLNQVVLVPDEATYLDEISRWTPEARWPILFEREPFASQFIRRFAPEKVLRRISVSRGGIEDIGREMRRVVASAWGGDGSVKNAFADHGFSPLGVVLTSVKDPARTAAVALAAGRGQLLQYMTGKWGSTNQILDAQTTSSLLQEVETLLSDTSEHFAKIGDTIDAITICQTMPARVTFGPARANPVALSDVIGRNESGERFAWTGWIFGSKANAAYIAMCSLFLDRHSYWFSNTYPRDGGWEQYGIGIPVLDMFEELEIEGTAIDGTLASLQQADVGGVTSDVIYFMSKGNQDFLEMSDERTAPTWLPILNTPSALYFIHSWSLKNPGGRSTVGGTWLSRGVYAYVGSSHEPTLGAFVPPTEVIHRTLGRVPFLPASRWLQGQGQFSGAWRVNTFGDPLMLCLPKKKSQRILKPADAMDDYQDLQDDALLSAQVATETPSDVFYASAIDAFLLIGNDDGGVEQWTAAIDQNVAGAKCASAALPALFRLQNIDSFVWAFKLLESPTRLEKDMLWQLVGTSKTAPLQLLVKNLRKPYALDDLLVIADRIAATKGVAALRSIIEKELKKSSGRNMRGLDRMLKKYGG